MIYSLTWLPEVLQAAGLKVAECDDWRSRGRREMGTVRGVMCHHTAGRPGGNMPSLDTIKNGRPATPGTPALAGPLAQLALGRDGTFYVVAAGLANHAGPGSWHGIATGNTSFIGIEAENTGSEEWPAVQMDAYRRGVAAILKRIGAPAEMCCGHKEYRLPAGTKVDPSFDMGVFRAAVAAILRGEGTILPQIPAADANGRPTLRRSAKGTLVERIQQTLALNDDGVFGPATEAAVRAFQRTQGLVDDGIVGPASWRALEAFRAAPPAAPVLAAAAGLAPSEACLALVKKFEGCRLDAYPDPGSGGDPWTIGWGSTGSGIAKGVTWTQQQCDDRLAQDIADFAIRVARLVAGHATSQHQFDAMVSFAYNLGLAALDSSTLLRLHKAGNYGAAAAQFGRWTHAGGRELAGLVKRRAAEAALYRS